MLLGSITKTEDGIGIEAEFRLHELVAIEGDDGKVVFDPPIHVSWFLDPDLLTLAGAYQWGLEEQKRTGREAVDHSKKSPPASGNDKGAL